jgi:hypothetical protein
VPGPAGTEEPAAGRAITLLQKGREVRGHDGGEPLSAVGAIDDLTRARGFPDGSGKLLVVGDRHLGHVSSVSVTAMDAFTVVSPVPVSNGHEDGPSDDL